MDSKSLVEARGVDVGQGVSVSPSPNSFVPGYYILYEALFIIVIVSVHT